MALSTRIKQLRQKHDLTQEELAERLGVTRQSLISLEAGRSVPSIALALRIAGVFNLPLDSIFWLTDANDEPEEERGGENEMPKDLTPWSPWRDMMSLRQTIDRMFEEPTLPRYFSGDAVFPRLNIRETEKAVIVEADVPGVTEEEIDIEVHSDALVISGSRSQTEEVNDENFYHREVAFGTFSRAVALPAEVVPEKANAEIENGILKIELVKVEAKQPKKIKLKPKIKLSISKTEELKEK